MCWMPKRKKPQVNIVIGTEVDEKALVEILRRTIVEVRCDCPSRPCGWKHFRRVD